MNPFYSLSCVHVKTFPQKIVSTSAGQKADAEACGLIFLHSILSDLQIMGQEKSQINHITLILPSQNRQKRKGKKGIRKCLKEMNPTI